jgi:hypothetical protein
VAQNFGGIPQMREEYFLLQREIYRWAKKMIKWEQ